MAELIALINNSLNITVKELYNVVGKPAESLEDLQITGDIGGLYYINSYVYYFLVLDNVIKSYLIN